MSSKATEKLGKERQRLKAERLAATQAIINSPEWQAKRAARYRARSTKVPLSTGVVSVTLLK